MAAIVSQNLASDFLHSRFRARPRILDCDFHANRGALGIDRRRCFPDIADGGHIRTRDQRQGHVAVVLEARGVTEGDSVVLTRFSMGSIHDGPSEE
jgi:hypothetical protein